MSGQGTGEGEQAGEQLALIRSALPKPARPTRTTDQATASTDPVASVVVDTGLAHLARPFEYLVPEALAATAVPGVRVKVRFAGQDLDGFVVDRQPRGRARGAARPDPSGGLARAGAHADPAAGGHRGRGVLRRHPRRRAPAGRPAPARGGREGPGARGAHPRPAAGAGGPGPGLEQVCRGPAYLAAAHGGRLARRLVAGAAHCRTRAGLAGGAGHGGRRDPRRRAGQRAGRARPP